MDLGYALMTQRKNFTFIGSVIKIAQVSIDHMVSS
jgi:hypothetical protein